MNDTNDSNLDLDRLIDQIKEGTISREELSRLEERLFADAALRKEFRSRMRMEGNLYSECQSSPAEIVPPVMMASPRSGLGQWRMAAVTGLAAVLAMGVFLMFQSLSNKPKFVATIVSEEGAAWSAGGMVGEGAGLSSGTMRLEKGLASLRFESGVIVDLEAPVTIDLLNPMRCRLSRGKAVFEVPESAVGFVVETPNGHAVDHGTRFAVALQENSEEVEFGVLSGKISVHHDKTKAIADVLTGDMVMMTPSGITGQDNTDVAQAARAADTGLLRISANGRETSIVHGDIREEFLEPGLLMVKRDMPVSNENQLGPMFWPKDRRSLIAFELGDLDRSQVQQATLRLNMVPSGRGYARMLPERTTIEVYGIRDNLKLEHWDTTGLKWADAPGSVGDSTEIEESEVQLLGSFEVERSFLEGPVVFQSSELTRVIREDGTGLVGLLLVSASLPQEDWSLVHAFASSHHLEAAGPMLEIKVK